MRPIVRTELVYIRIAAGAGFGQGGFFNFPDFPQLRGCYITGAMAYTDAMLTHTPDRVAVVPAAEALRLAVTFNEGSDERIRLMPYAALATNLQAGIWKDFDPFLWDVQKSGVTLMADMLTSPWSAAINVNYVRPEELQAYLRGLAQVRAGEMG